MAFNFWETNFNIVVTSLLHHQVMYVLVLVVGSVEFVIQCGTLTSSETKDFTGQTCVPAGGNLLTSRSVRWHECSSAVCIR